MAKTFQEKLESASTKTLKKWLDRADKLAAYYPSEKFDSIDAIVSELYKRGEN